MTDPGEGGARDAWLSQALRHAPDSDAAPPTALSEAILVAARAAAAARPMPSRRQGARAGGRTLGDVVRAAWTALARPPVAAAFASVMAATIVGLMWWDRPMDETMPRPPSAAADRLAAAAPQKQAAAAAAQPPAENAERSAPSVATGRLQASPQSDRPARAGSALKSEAPAAFPPQETKKETTRSRLDEDRKDAATSSLAESNAPRARAENAAAAAPLAAGPTIAQAPVVVTPSAPSTVPMPAPVTAPAPPAAPGPLDGGRFAGQMGSAASTDRVDKALAKNAAPAREAVTATAAPAQRPGDADRRDGADALERDKLADAAPPDAFARRDAQDSRRQGAGPAAAASPLTPLLDAIAREPQRWTRRTSTGATATLDPAWRGWLAELDAAAAGRWQASTARTPAFDDERDGAALRLFVDGRAAAIVRLDGPTLRLDTSLGAAPGHWQSTLSPAASARLDASRTRLSP
jgi:hypothetical protein